MKKRLKNYPKNLDGLVTVVMPVKNGMPLIKDAIDSINRQSIPPSKVILADNNSEDKTIDFFKKSGKK